MVAHWWNYGGSLVELWWLIGIVMDMVAHWWIYGGSLVELRLLNYGNTVVLNVQRCVGYFVKMWLLIGCRYCGLYGLRCGGSLVVDIVGYMV